MTTDNKTLADVQPGGRVRLPQSDLALINEAAALSARPSPGGQGDARALIQRYDAAAAKFRESLMDDRYSDAQRVELRRELTAVQDELLTALAARQSVGAQRAALWVQFAENGNIRFWTRDQDRALEESFLHARPLTAFYASPQQPAQAVDLDK